MTGLFIGQDIGRPRSLTPGEHGHQTRLCERPGEALERHRGDLAAEGPPRPTAAPMWGQQGLAGDRKRPLAIAQDDVGADGQPRSTPRALETPDRHAA
jgi:hypothetical protein